jgi:hypothetical protein
MVEKEADEEEVVTRGRGCKGHDWSLQILLAISLTFSVKKIFSFAQSESTEIIKQFSQR